MTEPGPEPGREHEPTQYVPPPEAPTQQFAPPPPPPRDRRTWWWVGGGIGVLVVVGLVIGLVLGGGSDGSTPAAAPGPSVVPTPGSAAPAGGKHRTGAAGLRVGKNITALQGPVTAVTDGKLTITPDGLPAVTVATASSTKVSGGGVTALTDLRPGEQVLVLVKDGTATQVRVRPAGAGKGGGTPGSSRPTG